MAPLPHNGEPTNRHALVVALVILGAAAAVALAVMGVGGLAAGRQASGEAGAAASPTGMARPTGIAQRPPAPLLAGARPSPLATSTSAATAPVLGAAAPEGPAAAAAIYQHGLDLEAAGDHAAAAEAFRAYGAAAPAMRDIAALAAGNNLLAAGDLTGAVTELSFALADSPDPGTRFLAALRLGATQRRLGTPADAVAAYEDALQRAQSAAEKALALEGLVALARDQGNEVDALQRYEQIVREAPESGIAREALTALEAAGRTVAPDAAATILLAAGEPSAARLRLDAAAAAPEEAVLVARTHLAEGSDRDAAAALEPAEGVSAEAAWLLATTRAGFDTAAAAETFLRFADAYPADPRAAEALWRAGRTRESSDPAAAAAAYEAVGRRYGDTEEGVEGAFRAGLLAWRAGDTEAARTRWAAAAGGDELSAARAHLWLGRLAAEAGDEASATEHWRKAAVQEGVYGLLARRRLAARAALVSDRAQPAESADALATWLGLAPEEWDAAVSAARTSRSHDRVEAWLALGRRASAVTEARRALGDKSAGPVPAAAWAIVATELGLTDAATSAAVTAALRQPAPAPAALDRLVYPLGYREAALVSAAEQGVPPALLFALVRQESLFNPEAESSVGALGLTQVMPDTGRSIAQRMGVEGFNPEQLVEPEVALRFGARYLAEQLAAFDGNDLATIAAYNGGPGNARRWLDDAADDPEVFVEAVDYAETRSFIRKVTANRAAYERLYPELATAP